MIENEIKAEGLTKVFNGSLVAVDHIDFSVKNGEIFGFLGPNGAGKTTTINMLITVLKPTEGKAEILGYDIAKQNTDVRYTIGVVPQEYTADEDLTGYENILLCADLYGIPRGVSKKRAADLLELVELTDFKDKKGNLLLNQFQISYSYSDQSPPQIVSVVVEDKTTIQCYFSEKMDHASITKKENYKSS